ncbi:hypothetical protein DKX38_022462 [Salix brachista]|uniref:Amine oxidase domain-containing protein n=1 Tax=Salix brachista TaxID=2182728 RepID=A0A5N5K4B3_9ROSI|nr:hypothetical protein DKX38_022462 [Salix brachista]
MTNVDFVIRNNDIEANQRAVTVEWMNGIVPNLNFPPYDKARNAVALALSPVVRALIDPDGALRDIRDLDSISFSDWFLSKGGTHMSIQRMWDPVAYALGFIDCDNISARCMLTIFSLFATKTEASLLRMLKGSPDVYLSGPIRKYIEDKGGRFHLRWGCRQILYDRSPDGEILVTGLATSKGLRVETKHSVLHLLMSEEEMNIPHIFVGLQLEN